MKYKNNIRVNYIAAGDKQQEGEEKAMRNIVNFTVAHKNQTVYRFEPCIHDRRDPIKTY